MFRALWTSASGMTAQQTNLDIISHNMANVSTVGYKKMRPTFQDSGRHYSIYKERSAEN